MKQLNDIVLAQKKALLVMVVASVLTGMAVIGQAYFFVTIVDRVFLDGQSFQTIVPLLSGLLVVLFARTFLTYLNGRAGVKMAAKAKQQLRRSLIQKYTKNPVQASLLGQSGQKVSVMLDAVDEVDSYFSQYVPQVIKTSVIPLLILIAVFTQHFQTGLIMVITAPFIPVFFVTIGLATKKKSEQQMEKLAAFSGSFLDTLQGLTTLKLFGRAERQKEVIRKNSTAFRDATMDILKIAFSSSLMLEFITILSIGLIALNVASQLVVFEAISFFTAFFVLVLAPEFYLSIKDLGTAFHTGRGSMGAAQKVEDELREEEQAVSWGSREFANTDIPPTILLRNTGFRYHENGFALKHLHADILPYQQVAIVGQSGSGKTTLLHLIAGLIEAHEGEIAVDGEKLPDYKEEAWYDRLSYISQQPYLFSGTVADNIAIGAQKPASDAEIQEAARKAGIADMIENLEAGYGTVIGEAGRGLSGGEKQRIAIARAFLKRPSVILFDEPTTGLDLETEKILQKSIKELSQHATVITVAHRLHTIQNADQILLLSDGELTGKGTHRELLDQVETYREMVSVQQGGTA